MGKSLFQVAKNRLDRAARERLPTAERQFARAKQGAEQLKQRLQEALASAEPRAQQVDATIQAAGKSTIGEPQAEPPVVARLVIEIRSDGTRTVARGALQDELNGERVAIEARGNSPLELAGQLARSLLTSPFAGLGFGAQKSIGKRRDSGEK
jgi:hypothetical protein